MDIYYLIKNLVLVYT